MESFRLYIVVDVSSLSLSPSFSRAFAPLNRTSATVCGLLPNMAVWRTREKQQNKRSAGGAVDDVYLKGKERTSRRMRLLSLYHWGFFFSFSFVKVTSWILGRIKDEFRFLKKKKVRASNAVNDSYAHLGNSLWKSPWLDILGRDKR